MGPPPCAASSAIVTEAVVIGAGPIGLFAVFQLGLQGIHAHVVDVLPQAGGQCSELYPDKPIYDLPGIARCTGQELTERLLQQITPFKPSFHFNQQVSQLSRHGDEHWLLSTPQQSFLTRTVFIAAGVGAFVPKELKIDGLAAFADRQLFYRRTAAEHFLGQDVLVVGGDELALDSAISLASADQSRSVTLLHRRDVLSASEHQLAQLAELRQQGRVKFVAGQISGIQTNADRLTAVQVSTPDDDTLSLPLDVLLVCSGLSPKLGPLTQWGLAMERKQLVVDAASFATSAPGIYAIGDINHYPGKKKLLVCGFHEATLAAFAAASLLHPGQSGVLQYTSSSSLLQQRLGVVQATPPS